MTAVRYDDTIEVTQTDAAFRWFCHETDCGSEGVESSLAEAFDEAARHWRREHEARP